MKKTLFLLVIIFAGSCTVQKKLHSRGYHVEWRKKHTSDNSDLTQKPSDKIYSVESEISKNDSLISDLPTDINLQKQDVELDSSITKNNFHKSTTTIVKSLPILKKKVQVGLIKKQAKTNAKENKQEPVEYTKSPSTSFLLTLLFVALIFLSPIIFNVTGLQNFLFLLLYIALLCLLIIIFSIRTIALSIQQKRDYYLIVFSVLILLILFTLITLSLVVIFTF
jgi:hypothetical protein